MSSDGALNKQSSDLPTRLLDQRYNFGLCYTPSMFWLQTRFLLAVIASVGIAALFICYLRLAYDTPLLIEFGLGSVVLLGAWYAAANWLIRAESLGSAAHRVGLALKVLAALAVVPFGSLLFGYFNEDPNLLARGLSCPDCPSIAVTRVIDGDTLVISGGLRVRLFGINATEAGERCSEEATAELRRLAGDRVRTEDGPRLIDNFDRRLAYLYRENGDSIDAELIRKGLAFAWTRDGQHLQELVALEETARESRVGCLW